MSLRVYRTKRTFDKTPEPKGGKTQTSGPLTFVIQKHQASRLHYDFRLELDGTLKSWAVPKGPSANPEDKRLAVMVEDHPLDYASFEGIIPKGNYGGGTVMVWDRGVYTPIIESTDRKEAEQLLKKQLQKGHLTFVLLGEKLQGEYALIKTHGGEENAWLLIKAGDIYASKKDILKKDRSVLTGRSMEEIRDQKSDVWISKPSKSAMPHDVKPMLAKSIDAPFDDTDWLFEMKYDGYRAIAEIDKGKVLLYSRNGISFEKKFAPIVSALQRFTAKAVLDGEVVVVDSEGKPRFQWLQDYPDGEGMLLYYVFDLLYYDGRDLTSLPLSQRKQILKDVLPDLPSVRYGEHIEASGVAMFDHIKKLGIEGIMAKNKYSPYHAGVRSDDWLKIKNGNRQEVVIGGFTEPKGTRNHFGALVVGVYKRGKLIYVGHVGGGFDEKTLTRLKNKLQPLVQPNSPFAQKPETNAPVTWVKPVLLAEVAYSNWTADGQMRHPVFIGLRDDKASSDVVQEQSADTDLTYTHLSKLFWPKEKYTKGNLIAYYREIAPIILPYLKDRPESLLRYPDGVTGNSFYQKDAKLLDTDYVNTTAIRSESHNKEIKYALCQNETALLYLVNLGCIDFNPWSSRVGSLEQPDYLLIDLDPLDVEFTDVVKTALAARKLLERLEITSFVKTSGATGMHIYIPLAAKYTYEQTRNMAQLLCLQINAAVPDITSMKRNPKERKGLVYLDYLQNIKGQTLASAYSVRAQPGATVSAPLLWSEVTAKLHPSQFTMKNMQRRIQKHGDLFKGVLGTGMDMEKVLRTLNDVLLDRLKSASKH